MKHIRTYEEINEEFIDDTWDWMKDNAHLLLPVAEIGSMFIPVIGPFLAMGFGLGDAALYAKEGDKMSAGISAAFSILPGIASIGKIIPGVKQLGKEGMEQLGKKVINKEVGSLTKVEKEVLDGISKNPKLIKGGVIKELEQTAAAKFNPASCAIKMVGESLKFQVLNESACEAGAKMVQLATHNPKLITGFKKELFDTSTEKLLNAQKSFEKFGKQASGSIKIESKAHLKEVQKLNQELIDHLKVTSQQAKRSDIPFNDIPEGLMINQYGKKSQELTKMLERGEISPNEWANKIYSMNNQMLGHLKKAQPRYDTLISDGKNLKLSYDELFSNQSVKPKVGPIDAEYGPYGGFGSKEIKPKVDPIVAKYGPYGGF